MNDVKWKLAPPAALTIPLEDAQALLEAGNGDAALLYLHTLRNGGVLDGTRAATELHRSDRDIQQAAGRLRQMGLLSADGGREPVPAPARELPEYQARDVVRQSMESREFQDLVEEVQRLLGRILNTTELKKLFGIYSDLAMPADVIMMLVQHCREEHGGNVGFRTIETEAGDWFNREIMTYEQAEQWLGQLQRRKAVLSRFQRELGIASLSPTARTYLNEWMDMGFGEDALIAAGDRTLTQTGRLQWKYMNTIIHSWHDKGLHTLEEIEKGDKRPGKPVRSGKYEAVTAPTQQDAKTLEQLARLREKMKNS